MRSRAGSRQLTPGSLHGTLCTMAMAAHAPQHRACGPPPRAAPAAMPRCDCSCGTGHARKKPAIEGAWPPNSCNTAVCPIAVTSEFTSNSHRDQTRHLCSCMDASTPHMLAACVFATAR